MSTIHSAPLPRISTSVSRQHSWRTVFSWLLRWELYPLTFMAVFLRFYQFPTTPFTNDQSSIYILARHALVHGLIPITANGSSIGTLNPPATVFMLMIGAVFTANPYADVAVTALLNVLAVLFTYAVVCRYYGRIAGTVAAFLYATAQGTIFYSGFLWNQNLLAPFVPLFILALLWGVVEQKKGWLAPSVALWGWMIQLHASAILLAIPLALACILAFKTLRWRDVLLAIGLLLLLYAPYIAWEFVSHFFDVPLLLKNIGAKSKIDNQALSGYLSFLSPYVVQPTDPRTAVYKFYSLLHRERQIILLLLVCAFAFAIVAVVQNRWKLPGFVPRGQRLQSDVPAPATGFRGKLRAWWIEFSATPWRKGLLVLLVWQILPVIYLSHHSVKLPIHGYYMLSLMPGPFILLGILAAQVMAWLGTLKFPWPLARYAFALLLICLVLGQSLGSLARTSDEASGYDYHGYTDNSLSYMQSAVSEADRLARLYHAHQVYIAHDYYAGDSLAYLAEQMQTPHTIFDSSNCLLLPGLAQGPALMLLGPYDILDEALLKRFTSARLVGESPRLAGPPFHFYLLQPASLALSGVIFAHDLAAAASRPEAFLWENLYPKLNVTGPQTPVATPLLVTRWEILRTAPVAYGTSYNYKLDASYHGNGLDGASAVEGCSFSNLQSGEQMLTVFHLPAGSSATPASLSLTGTTWLKVPYDPSYGPLHLETIWTTSMPAVPLRSADGSATLTLQG